MYPVDAVKTRMQMLTTGSSPGINRGMMERMMGMASKEGLSSLWRGISSVAIGAGPAHAVQFLVYEETAAWVLSKEAFANHNWLANGTGGAAAAVVNDALMTPFDGTFPYRYL